MSISPNTDVIRAIVTEAPIPLVLLGLRSRVIDAVSEPMLELVGQPRGRVVGHLVTEFSAQPATTTALFDLLADGQLDGYQTVRKLRRGDGETVECTVWVRTLDVEHERNQALVVAGPRSDVHWVLASSVDGPPVIGAVDDHWRITSVSTDVERLLGVPAEDVVGVDVFTGIHPSDHADLLVATAAVIADRRASNVRLRVRHADGRWIRVRLQLAVCTGGASGSYVFTMTPVGATEGGDDAARLEEHLRRIGLEVRAAGVSRMDASPDVLDDRVLQLVDRLTARQWDIVSRLLAGDRVPGIARDLFLSPSTVRNHLADVFAKVGVHSQEELLRLLRSRTDGVPTSR